VLLIAALGIRQVFFRTLLRVGVGGNVNFVAIHAAQVSQITPVRRRVLREGKERIGIHLRFAQGGDQEASPSRAAKVNAAGRYGVDDVPTERDAIFVIAVVKSLEGAIGLQRCLPLGTGQPFVARTRVVGLRSPFLQGGEGTVDDWPVSFRRRGK